MKLLLVRHGQTEENAHYIVQGQRPGTLSALGKKQAEKVAKKLAGEHFDAMYTSDLARCVDTAEAIAKYHKGVVLHVQKELREFTFGIFEGKRSPRGKWVIWLGAKLPKGFLGVEAPQDVRGRVLPFINQVYKEHKNDAVLVVTHGGPVRIIKSALDGLPLSAHIKMEVPNCSVLRLAITQPLPEK